MTIGAHYSFQTHFSLRDGYGCSWGERLKIFFVKSVGGTGPSSAQPSHITPWWPHLGNSGLHHHYHHHQHLDDNLCSACGACHFNFFACRRAACDLHPKFLILGVDRKDITWQMTCACWGFKKNRQTHLHLQLSRNVKTNAKNFGPPLFHKVNYLLCVLWSQTLLVPTVLVLSACNTYL